MINVKYNDGKLEKIDPAKEGEILLDLKIKGRKQVYVLINSDIYTAKSYNQTDVVINNTNLGMYPSTYSNRVLDAGQYKDEEVSISLNLKSNEFTFDNFHVYEIDTKEFENWYNIVKQQQIKNIEISQNRLSGTVEAKDNGLLFTSIPWSEGWEVNVNGEQGRIKKVLGSFIAIEVEKGKNNLDLQFTPPGFKIGSIISAISLILLLLLAIAMKVNKRKNHKEK